MTIAEIAKLAGVSSAAVSRYFNNGYLSEAKKETIRKVVEETGYRPSMQAATLRTKKTKLIGVILPRLNSHTVGSIVEGIVNNLEKEGYHALIAHTQNDIEKEMAYLELFNFNNVDGLIFSASIFTEKHLRLLSGKKIPIVIIGQQLKGYNCVYFDDFQSIYDMTKLVLDKGRKNLSYISSIFEDEAVGAKRYKGYVNAVIDEDLLDLRKRYEIAGFDFQDGYDACERLLKRFPDTDAIICSTDSQAIGALQYCHECGIRVPEDIMITGQGNASTTMVTTPTVTTIKYSYEEAGERAAGLLLDMINAKETKTVMQMKLGYEIIEHDSTKD